MPANKNIMFLVVDPFGNQVVLYENKWLNHTAQRHDENLVDLSDVQESVLNPDQIRRSLHPVIGEDSCVFERFIAPNLLLRTPVLYDVSPGGSYEDGGNKGHVLTSFFPDPPFASKNVGKVFWTKPPVAKGEAK